MAAEGGGCAEEVEVALGLSLAIRERKRGAKKKAKNDYETSAKTHREEEVFGGRQRVGCRHLLRGM